MNRSETILVVVLAAAVALCVGCGGGEIQREISTYYSMVYDLGYEAFNPIAEVSVEPGDRILIVSYGQWLQGVAARYGYEYEGEPFDLTTYLADHPFFTEYLEDGFIRSFLDNQGVGFERMSLAGYMKDYVERLREERYIFNTSLLQYDWWSEIEDDFSINKLLIYSVHRVVDKESDYVGIQLGMKFIDVADDGAVLYNGIKNMTSGGYPGNEMKLLDRIDLAISNDATSGYEESLAAKMTEDGLETPFKAVLMKVDDIPVFGHYPLTVEDFAIEQQLSNALSALESVDIVEKLFKRHYKTEWQLTNAVYNINPFSGGDFDSFQQYYGTNYLMTYRVLWSEQTKILEDIRDDIIDITDHVQGAYVTLIDMNDGARIVFADFIPFGSRKDYERNFLYRCFTEAHEQSVLIDEIAEMAVVSPDERVVVINKRMEILKNYIMNRDSLAEAVYETVDSADNAELLTEYDKAYALLGPDEKKRKDSKGDGYYLMAALMMNEWFEAGLVRQLVMAGYQVYEKMESIYSRYLIAQKYNEKGLDDTIFLSPLLLKGWGTNIKSFYDLDKVIYYIPLEKVASPEEFVTPEDYTDDAAEISQFYPILNFDLGQFMLSILDVRTGDYVFNKNFQL